jgi:SSS family solute:Na+ symporter
VAVLIGVSYATPAPVPARIAGLAYATVSASDRAESRASWDWRDAAGTATVLLLILLAYVYFSG